MTLPSAKRERMEWPAGSALTALFLVALAIRWAYAAAICATMGMQGFISGDSNGYLSQGQRLVEYLAGALSGWAWLGVDLSTMPLYPWLVAANILAAGSSAPLTIVLCQGVIDAGTCLLVYGIASSIVPRYVLLAGLAACLNPTQIVLSGIVYTDTIFTFFAALALFGAIRWQQSPAWRNAVIIGLGLCGGALTRVLIVLWAPVVALFLLLAVATGRRLVKAHVLHFVAIGAAVALILAPVLIRNVTKYGAWALTAQGGSHLALWVVPLVTEAHNGTPWATSTKLLEKQFRARFPNDQDNPFVESEHYAQFGRERLAEIGAPAIIKAWLTGAALNLGTPAIIIAPPVAHLPRTGFYDTKTDTTFGKIASFLFHSNNALYARLMLIGVAGLTLVRLIQVIGCFALLKERSAIAPLLLLGLWIGFILAVNGPVASPKYRLPIEPPLMVLAGAGLGAWRDWRRRRRGQAAE